MTTDEIKASRAICDAATPGPWEWDANETLLGQGPQVLHAGDSGFVRSGDKTFIAHARTALPAALDRIKQLQGALHDIGVSLHYRNDSDPLLAIIDKANGYPPGGAE